MSGTTKLALGEYLRAYREVPRDPLVNLLVAVGYLSHVMSRRCQLLWRVWYELAYPARIAPMRYAVLRQSMLLGPAYVGATSLHVFLPAYLHTSGAMRLSTQLSSYAYLSTSEAIQPRVSPRSEKATRLRMSAYHSAYPCGVCLHTNKAMLLRSLSCSSTNTGVCCYQYAALRRWSQVAPAYPATHIRPVWSVRYRHSICCWYYRLLLLVPAYACCYCSAICGTEVEYAAAAAVGCAVLGSRMLLRMCCAMCGTEIAYAAMRCVVLRERMLLPGDDLQPSTCLPPGWYQPTRMGICVSWNRIPASAVF
eukprot:3406836-Rhodomonas_salina.3